MGAFLGRLMGRILLYEHFTATSDSASPLYAEGKAMVDAVAADLCGVRGIEVKRWIGREPLALARTSQSVDAVILIAPETGGVLLLLCRAVEEAGGVLLGPSLSAIEVTGDKLRLARHLTAAGVPTHRGDAAHRHRVG